MSPILKLAFGTKTGKYATDPRLKFWICFYLFVGSCLCLFVGHIVWERKKKTNHESQEVHNMHPDHVSTCGRDDHTQTNKQQQQQPSKITYLNITIATIFTSGDSPCRFGGNFQPRFVIHLVLKMSKLTQHGTLRFW